MIKYIYFPQDIVILEGNNLTCKNKEPSLSFFFKAGISKGIIRKEPQTALSKS